jgi:hypothetical protein
VVQGMVAGWGHSGVGGRPCHSGAAGVVAPGACEGRRRWGGGMGKIRKAVEDQESRPGFKLLGQHLCMHMPDRVVILVGQKTILQRYLCGMLTCILSIQTPTPQ